MAIVTSYVELTSQKKEIILPQSHRTNPGKYNIYMYVCTNNKIIRFCRTKRDISEIVRFEGLPDKNAYKRRDELYICYYYSITFPCLGRVTKVQRIYNVYCIRIGEVDSRHLPTIYNREKLSQNLYKNNLRSVEHARCVFII